jgi:hypothetical protein
MFDSRVQEWMHIDEYIRFECEKTLKNGISRLCTEDRTDLILAD